MPHVADTDPYAWPYDGRVATADLALVVCGAQQALAAGAAAEAVTAALAAVDRVATALRDGGGTVIWVRHGRRATDRRAHSSLPVHGSSGWQLVVPPGADDLVVDAAGWDGCFSSDLEHVTRDLGTPHVLLAGCASELTVDSTVRTLNDRGVECLVLTDACAPVDPELGRRAHHSLTMSGGIFGALGTSSSVLSALDREPVPSLPRSHP